MSKVLEIIVPEYSDKESARKAINELMGKTDVIELEAEAIADEFGISFSVGDYGYGRTYYPKGADGSYMGADYYDWPVDENGNLTEGQWLSSSDMC